MIYETPKEELEFRKYVIETAKKYFDCDFYDFEIRPTKATASSLQLEATLNLDMELLFVNITITNYSKIEVVGLIHYGEVVEHRDSNIKVYPSKVTYTSESLEEVCYKISCYIREQASNITQKLIAI